MDNPTNMKALTSDGGAKTRKPSAMLMRKLTIWFEKWTDMFPAHPIAKSLVSSYADALSDLSPEQLDTGCREVTCTAELFPKPAQIRAALRRVEGLARTRPEYLDEPRLSPQERWTDEEVKRSNEQRKRLGLPLLGETSAK